MAEISSQAQDNAKEREQGKSVYGTAVGVKIQNEKQIWRGWGGIEEKPTRGEVFTWNFYAFCTYFVLTVLVPVVFPLIISKAGPDPPEPPQGWLQSFKGLKCTQKEMQLYVGLVHRELTAGGRGFSPLAWTSISWITGIFLSTPFLGFTSFYLDRGYGQQVIAGLATGIGAILCLPAGFFKKPGVFLPYIAAVVAASAVTGAWSNRHLALLIRGFTGSKIPKTQFPNRRSLGSKLSLYSTAAGCFGAVIMTSFTCLMLNHSDQFTALWVVSIFSGLLWGLSLIHIFSTIRGSEGSDDTLDDSVPVVHALSIFRFPHAAATLTLHFLSSFMLICIFGSVTLYASGYLCLKSHNILFLWFTYFLVPLVSLPLAHRLQQFMKFDTEKMLLIAFILSTVTSAFGFYYRGSIWSTSFMLLFATIQGTASGLFHALGIVLFLDCTPAGKEGAFCSWYSWVGAVGACAGFTWAAAFPGSIGKAFRASLCAGIVGMVLLIFGNISSFKGAKSAGHIIKKYKSAPGDHHFKGSETSEVPNEA